jgi:hypothetical protein
MQMRVGLCIPRARASYRYIPRRAENVTRAGVIIPSVEAPYREFILHYNPGKEIAASPDGAPESFGNASGYANADPEFVARSGSAGLVGE